MMTTTATTISSTQTQLSHTTQVPILLYVQCTQPIQITEQKREAVPPLLNHDYSSTRSQFSNRGSTNTHTPTQS